MVIKIKWGKEHTCGAVGCDKQINWGEFTSYHACENHRNRKWELCEACQTEKTTHSVYYDIIEGERSQKQAYQEVRKGIKLQKAIIRELFLAKNISGSLKEKLNAAYEKCLEAEKNIPELEKLAQEYWEKKLNCASDLVREKGGQQTNIYECNLCENCGNEVDIRQEKLKNNYQLNVLNKLVVFDSKITTQIKKEIGKDEVLKIIYDPIFDGKSAEEKVQVRYFFRRKLPFFKSKESIEQKQKKKANFLKLKQFFQDNQIMQIVDKGTFDCIIWYANGNIEEKWGPQLSEWDKLNSYLFYNDSEKGLSLHEINRVLASLEQEPSLSEQKEEETALDKNKEKEENSKANKNLLPELELELVKLFFRKNKIKKIALVNGELVITHNNNNNNNNNNENITAEQLTNNYEYQMIKSSLEKTGKNELTSQDLDLDFNNSTNPGSPKQNKHQLVLGLVLGAVILVGTIIYFILKRKKKNE